MAHAIGESRSELLGWINELLQINYTKVEQCGNGAVYCQIIDSIFLDVPMSKVKLSARQEFEYINNLKVLQTQFKRHKIDKPVPIEQLKRCKMQDNLEFLQWMKKFWDANYPGGEYDAVGRRSGAAVDTPGPRAPSVSGSAPRTAAASARPSASAARKAPGAASTSRVAGAGAGAAAGAASAAAVQALTSQMSDMRVTVDGLEKERDFYFAKLRDIEILIGARLESNEPPVTEDEAATLKEIQEILYQTEDGFEVPDAEEGDFVEGEEETF